MLNNASYYVYWFNRLLLFVVPTVTKISYREVDVLAEIQRCRILAAASELFVINYMLLKK